MNYLLEGERWKILILNSYVKDSDSTIDRKKPEYTADLNRDTDNWVKSLICNLVKRLNLLGILSSITTLSQSSAVQYKYNASHICNFRYFSSNILKSENIKINLMFYLTQCIKYIFQCHQNIIIEIFYIFYFIKNL